MEIDKENSHWFQNLVTGAVFAAGMAVAVKGVSKFINSNRKLQLRDKIILVTGGSRGLGIVLARKLAGYDATVVICGRSEETLQKAAAELASLTDKYLAIPCNVTDKQQVEQLIQQIKHEVGSVDILINNAGIIEVGPMEAMNQADYEKAIKTHFWGPFYLINEVLPDMKEKKMGSIVNIASIGSKVSFPHLLPYNTSKFALGGFSEGLAAELAKDNITVTTVYPGLMRTGSPRNIDVKGKHTKEYAWFKIADSLPLLSIDADRAATKIIEALRQGKRTLKLSMPAKIAIAAHNVAPELTITVFNIVDSLLPGTRQNDKSRKGYESKSKISESSITDKTDAAARDNLEV